MRTCSRRFSFQAEVVYETGVADAHGGGEDAGLEVGLLEVVDLEAVEQAPITGSQRAGGSEGTVRLLVARVALQVFALAELRWVHEQARDHDLVLVARGAEEREVPLVEGAHRRDEADLALARKLGRRTDDPHATVASP